MISRALLIEHLKRFWAVPALSLLLYVLCVVLPFGNSVTNMNYSFGSWNNPYHYMTRIMTMRDVGMIFVTVGTPIIAAFCTFGCFFKRRTATSFYSMPISKKRLICTNALAGILLSVIPILCFCILFAIQIPSIEVLKDSVLANYNSNSISPDEIQGLTIHITAANVFIGVVVLFARLVITSVFYFAMAWLGFAMVGHGVIGLLLVALLPFVPVILLGAVELIARNYVFGLREIFSENVFEKFAIAHHPALWGEGLISGIPFVPLLFPVVSYLIIGALMLAGAFLISCRRKPELTGDSVIFTPVKNVLIFVVSCIGGVIIAAILYAMHGNLFMLHLGAALGFIVGYFIAQMLAEKSFTVLGKIRQLPHFFAVLLGLYAAVLLITSYGLGFYINRVPSESQIAGVYVTSERVWQSSEEMKRLALSSPEFISATQAAHRSILQERATLQVRPDFHKYSKWTIQGRYWQSHTLYINYILQNGSIVSRQYEMPSDFVKSSGMKEFFGRKEVVTAPFLILGFPESVDSLSLTFYIGGSRYNNNSYVAEARITSRAQINEALDIIADGMVRGSRANLDRMLSGQEEKNWVANTAAAQPMNAHFSYSMNERFRETWSRNFSYRTPYISSEAAEILHERVGEWGLLVVGGVGE
ncbi:MAG: hypothetical protein FWG87_01275 [Defluviitaleaceae bacterium]|nr:hypothetical protein [Defluviitaleaceae bacterium]